MEYKEREVAKAKHKAYEELYDKLDTKERGKDRDGNITNEEGVLRRWKKYFAKGGIMVFYNKGRSGREVCQIGTANV